MVKRILFICTHNSARSQMAQGLVNHFYGDNWQAVSAGTEKTLVKPLAIAAMADLGIDISHHTSKTLDRYINQPFDYVVTLCDTARETCPFFPGAGQQVHAGFADPSDVGGTEAEQLQAFIQTRDEIRAWLDTTPPSW